MPDCAEIVAAIESAIGRSLTTAEMLEACNGGACLLLDRLGIDRVSLPGGGYIERRGLFLGYEVEKQTDPDSMVAYYLHGPRVTYRLMRNVIHPNQLFALNSKGNVCNIKGNYRFIEDAAGRLRVAL